MEINPSYLPFATDRRFLARRPPQGVTIEKLRKAADAAMLDPEPVAVSTVEDRQVPIGGRAIELRFFRTDTTGPSPFILFVHGGGFVWGSVETHDGLCRRLCRETRATIVSVGYRLAPETRFPGPVEDVLAALTYLCGNTSALALDRNRFALCGDSAGANLALSATALAMAARLTPKHLCLLYPAVDPSCSSSSHKSYEDGPILTRDAMRWFWECYLGPEPVQSSAIHAPLVANMSGFPPTTIVTAEHDPLRDEGAILAQHMRGHGVEVDLHQIEGAVHGFLTLPAQSSIRDACIRLISTNLTRALEPS